MSDIYTTADRCRCCHSERIVPLFSLGDHYVNDFVDEGKYSKKYDGCPRCPINLDFCDACGLVQARYAVDMNLLYRGNYWYTSGRTATMREALADVVNAAMEVCPLGGGDIVLDIGSNDGTLLYNYPPGVVRVGVEPANNLAVPGNYENLVLIKDLWNYEAWEKYWVGFVGEQVGESVRAKIVTAIGMFYDLEDPNRFIADIAKVLAPDGVFIAQLMCLKQTMERRDVGNFCHEHLEFYSLSSLFNLLAKYDLGIFDIQENNVNGGSYRLFIRHRNSTMVQQTEAMKRRCGDAFTQETQMKLGDPKVLVRIYQDMLKNSQDLKAFLLREKARGRRIFVYGASTKGNTILQFAGIDDRILEGAAEKDPAKYGLYTVGTGVEIMSMEAVRQLDPDYMLVLPYAFIDEFMKVEQDQVWRKRGGKFIVPIPEIKIV